VNKELADKQTAHPLPKKKPNNQSGVGVLLLRYEQVVNQCRAKLGLSRND